MKKYLLYTIALLTPMLCISQKIYSFDYLTEYNFYLYKDSTVTKKQISVLTNSKDNSYLVSYSKTDSLNSTVLFRHMDKVYSKESFRTSQLEKAQTILLNCELIYRSPNPYKFRTKQYDFTILKDTLLDGKNYKHYQFKSNNPKREKRKKLATNYYIIDTETSFHLPILEFPTAYEEWKSNQSLPNGMIQELYQRNIDGKVIMKLKRINYKHVDIQLEIPKECEHVLEPIKINTN
ncbi:hypothetical protein M0G43_00070 [Subsaxibacter sp. CAU 1640]|uniref:hypothetical protein n=1 Tax=Subsaxibacter sp. CAU 1640 TaxID=2933271 RepID=UPI002005982A|nr:hypothetical protein [Subsaxibacter sp. CAU 1640]MCK7588958.1 hypothetical protein [Subsaxibacter sp. CAU 1640]